MKNIEGIWYSTITDNAILGFFRGYAFLSNFFPAPIVHRGIQYPTSEHMYMAMKTIDKGQRETIAAFGTPGQAKRYGSTITLRDDWEEIKVAMMFQACMLKFTQNAELGQKLLLTEGKYLEETNNHGDMIWGVCNGVGTNLLGKTLMAVRDEIRC